MQLVTLPVLILRREDRASLGRELLQRVCPIIWYQSFRLHGKICYHSHLAIIPLDR